MRVYHFVSAQHGLSDIRQRRLKVATLAELNDPFEFLGVDLRDIKLRHVLQEAKENVAATVGLLCFSRNRHNPVLWSHYAARHSGICLGFEAPDDHLHRVVYSRRRVVLELEQLKMHAIDKATVMRFLFTKYSHWRYEAEARIFVNLRDSVSENGLYFEPFADKLRLTTVIVGARSEVTRDELSDVLGSLAREVKVYKARLAFRTFRVVRQNRQGLWQ